MLAASVTNDTHNEICRNINNNVALYSTSFKRSSEDEKAMATSRHNQQIYWQKFVRSSNIPKKSVKERDPCLLTTSSSA